MSLTVHQAKYFAHELSLSYSNDHVGKLAGLLFDAQVDPKPHQIEAALFALGSPFQKGAILADEVGLGKTIEAGIVITQFWAERKRRILIITPSSLRQQWQQELLEKFFLSSGIVNSQNVADLVTGSDERSSSIIICSYEFALRHEVALTRYWDLVVADEAHRLRNFWTGRAKIAAAVSHIMESATKSLLLTATPLQNRLEELYGLVSLFEPGYFSSLAAFRERYVRKQTGFGEDDLAERVRVLSKRALRQDVDLYIQFTKRLPITVEFEPTTQELDLYERVNAILRREELFAFPGSQRHLGALILRKRLGSSTFAVAGTLEVIAARLRDLLAEFREDSPTRAARTPMTSVDDLIGEDADEWMEFSVGPRIKSMSRRDADLVLEEIREFESCARLAHGITTNAKGKRLLYALEQGFNKLKEIGAQQKAVVFTDSTKTQEYLRSVLLESGDYSEEDIVLFNGSNNSPAATRVYQAWRTRNEGSDLITGIPAVDRRKALVEAFRNDAKVLIATEAAAEGINLQFCSMVVNYDLPWNPQRVEQRIGRCHRYGQKHNVIVVNFSNQGNLAERRILELLDTKFHLFESIFGASDEVLGSIESGIDVEKAIGEILDQCTTAEEIDQAFLALSERFSDTITEEMQRVRERVFDSLDPHVQDRLKTQERESERALNRFEELFLKLTHYELRKHAVFEQGARVFELLNAPVPGIECGNYHFKDQPTGQSHQYRFASPLGHFVVESAINRETRPVLITFDIAKSSRVTAPVRALIGNVGVVKVQRLDFAMHARNQEVSESYLVSGAITRDGDLLDSDVVRDLMDLAAGDIRELDSSGQVRQEALPNFLSEQAERLTKEVQERNAKFYDQQEDILYRQAQDRRAESEARIRELRNKELDARKQARQSTDPVEQLKLKREARKWGQKADQEEDDARQDRQRYREEEQRVLDQLEESLQGEVQSRSVVEFQWRVIDSGNSN